MNLAAQFTNNQEKITNFYSKSRAFLELSHLMVQVLNIEKISTNFEINKNIFIEKYRDFLIDLV
jgi:hypothetical protein